MAELANHSLALRRALRPVARRNVARIYSIVNHEWFVEFVHERLQLFCHRSESSVEADHQHRAIPCACRLSISNDLPQLELVHAQWLLTKNILTPSDCGTSQPSMRVVTSRYDNGVDRVVS